MKFVVPVKAAAALDDEFELRDGSDVDPADLEYALNEWDSLLDRGRAARLPRGRRARRGRRRDGRRRRAEAGSLPSCLAKGADRALRISDEPLAGADPLAVATRARRRAWSPRQPDLILCGVQSSDAVNGATGVALAGFLDLAHVAVVKRLGLDPASAPRPSSGGFGAGVVELLRVRAPGAPDDPDRDQPAAVPDTEGDQAGPRDKPLPKELDLGDLGLDRAAVEAAAGSRRRALAVPDRSAGAQMLEGSVAEIAGAIAALVREWTALDGGDLSSSRETRRGELREISLELIGAALAVKDAAGGPLAVALIDADAAAHAAALATAGVDEVLNGRLRSARPNFEAHVAGRAPSAR